MLNGKRLYWIAVCIAILACLTCISAAAGGFYEERFCGDAAMCRVDTDTKMITIWGTGKVDCSFESAVWRGYGEILEVVIDHGITAIVGNIFSGCEELTTVTIPDSVTRIYKTAFDSSNPALTIVCNKGSYAETYAKENGIRISYYAPVVTGNCGDAVTYSLNPLSDTLTISGTGEMENYTSSAPAPWSAYPDDFRKVVIDSGVTSIGQLAFFECHNVETVTIPESVTSIGFGAFFNSIALQRIAVSDNVTEIGVQAFYSYEERYILCNENSYAAQYAAENDVKAHYYQHADFSEWELTTAPKDGVKGVETRTCNDCGMTETRAVALPGDVDGDTFLTLADVMLALQALLNGAPDISIDMGDDGAFTLLDILQMLKRMA